MWLLSFMPDSWLHMAVLAILSLGVLVYILSYFTGFIPTLIPAKEPIRIIGTLIIVAGVFFYGSYDTEISWRNRVAEAEAKVAQAEEASKKENVKIVTKVVTKTQIVRTRGEDIIRYVDREITKYDTKFAPGGVCEIPKEFIKAHNDAAEAPK